jgi:hypothetical protein
MDRRSMLLGMAAAAAATVLPAGAAARPAVRVFKSPSCGCCGDWVAHLKANGFDVTVEDAGNVAARARLGIPASLGSCHTAEVGGYAIEGHVPAADIRRLLAERPKARGLAVPGMPNGAPGMEQGGRRDPYDVLLVLADGTTSRYASYR